MWWAVWCFAVACCAGAVAAPAPPDDLTPLSALQLEHADSASNDDGMSYVMPAMNGRYASEGDAAPWFYLLEEVPRDAQMQKVNAMNERRLRPKRKMPSLSISNPMEVLRQRLMLEVARKQMREASQRQAVANRVFLQNVGKRGDWTISSLYDN